MSAVAKEASNQKTELPNKAAQAAVNDLLAKFSDEYRKAFSDAERAAEMTETEAWRYMYGKQKREFAAEKLRLSRMLAELAASLRDGTLIPDDIKAGKDVFKQYEEHQRLIAAFDRSTVDDVRLVAERPANIAERYREDAKRVERDNPLTHRDVGLLVIQDIDLRPTVRWDVESGTVVISGR